jgi:hypothetical protein
VPNSNEDTDFDNIDTLREKYADLKLAQGHKNKNPDTDITDEEKSLKRPLKVLRKLIPGKSPKEVLENYEDKPEACNTIYSVDQLSEIERTKLGVWIAKAFILFMMVLVIFLMAVFTFIAYRSNALPSMEFITGLITNLQEIFLAVFSSGSK